MGNVCVPDTGTGSYNDNDNDENNNDNDYDENDESDKKYNLLTSGALTTIRGSNLDEESILSNLVPPVGIFYEAFIIQQMQHQKVQMSERTELEHAQMRNVAIVGTSLIAKACMSGTETGTLSQASKDYLIKVTKAWPNCDDETLEIGLRGEADISDYPLSAEQNPFIKYGGYYDGNKTEAEVKHKLMSMVLMYCIVAASQHGLSRAQLNTIYAYADAVQVQRSYVKKLLNILKLEQELFRQMKQLW